MIPTFQLGGLGRARRQASPVVAVTWNPSDKGPNITLSAADMTLTNTATVWDSARTLGGAMTSGKWYDEAIMTGQSGTSSTIFGVCSAAYTMATYLGQTTNGFGIQGAGASGVIRTFLAGSAVDHTGLVTTGQRVKAAVDIAAGKGWLAKVGSAWIGGGDPAAGTSPTFTFTPGTTMYFAGSAYNAGAGSLTRVGGVYTDAVPSGFTGIG